MQEWITYAGVGIGAIIATVIARLGFTTNRKPDPVSETSKTLDVPVLMDTGALVRHTAAIEGLNVTAAEANMIYRKLVEILDKQVAVINDNNEELARVREELRVAREIANIRRN